MPDRTELPHASSGADDAVRPGPSRRPVEAVLFDFHGTLAQVEEPLAWVLAAAAACGVELDRIRATSLADRLLTACLADARVGRATVTVHKPQAPIAHEFANVSVTMTREQPA